ncbi:hypothetical protein C491_09164 [Natronococcus amylolyticus DSM 10524]|uniref:DUF7344 domain-containing protein n=1 Tax=Natronococcus amylolyticus DSM 10524 TaxID=1227497 RepID=L9X883_9EURY|nr:hypothetical protein [Natronococcus amylolyticus]ELY57954.1 hypothetical protein C491_09164 [Natronococcus amylolyticus DSM 10524]
MVELETVFELLREERRRYALYYLYERNGPVPVDELVETVEKWEDEGTAPELDSVDEIALELQHVHLPKSAEVEFIQYDPSRNLVQINGSPPEFDAFVTVAKLLESPGD